jgi:hypothetical protein
VRQRFVAVYTIDLRRGFWISGITTAQTGNPFTVVLGGPDTSGFNSGNRPDVVKAGPLPQNNDSPDAAFDISWFAPNGPGRNGTSGRNAYRGQGLLNFDLSVGRRFRLMRKDRAPWAELRADFFNSLNHTNFANPISDLNNASFGRITQTLGTAVGTLDGNFRRSGWRCSGDPAVCTFAILISKCDIQNFPLGNYPD